MIIERNGVMSMKKRLLILLLIVSFGIAGCEIPDEGTDPSPPSDPNDSSPTDEPIKKTDTKTLAYSTYIAGSFLTAETQEDSDSTYDTGPALLSTGTENAMSEIEKELGEVSTYFNQLRVFLDHGLTNPFTIEDSLDVNEDYAFEMRYTVEDKTYTILFNENDAGVLNGILIAGGREFILTGESENENEEGESEEEIYLKTTDKSNENNYIEIEIESSIEEDENAFEMSLYSMLDGIEKELTIEFESEEGEASIEIETADGNSYSFERESEDDGVTEYYFEYTIGDTEGEVELVITRQSDGTEVYHYTIEEDGKEIIIEDTHSDDEDDDDDEDDEDDSDENDDDDDEEDEEASLSL